MYRFLFKNDKQYNIYLIITVILIPLLVGGGFTLWDKIANHRGGHYEKYGYQLEVPSGWKIMEAEKHTWLKAKPRTGKRGATVFMGRKKTPSSGMSEAEKMKIFRGTKLPKDAKPEISQHPVHNCEVWSYEFTKPQVDYGETKPYDLLTRRQVIWHEAGPLSLLFSCDNANAADFNADWESMTRSIKPAGQS